jgi:tRNA(Ile)-lysidine synthase
LAERLIGLIRDGLPAGEVIGVALSGGGDSTALLHLCLAAGMRVEAVTVDHRLRPESAEEAASVAASCARLGVPHAVRVWDHGAVTGNLMDQARRARMALIADWARERGLRVVALGHTRDDQAETVLMGLARAAGISGLSGMRPEWEAAGVRFCRPLLGAGRAELRDWLLAEGIAWIDDPTNDDPRFTRIRARRALVALAPLGITAGRLAEVAANLAEVQVALDAQVAEAAGRLIHEEAGAFRIDLAILKEPGEVRRQLVTATVRWLSGADYAPRAGEIERLTEAMAAGRDATLAGCRWRKGWLMREPRAVADQRVPIGAVWDGRWRIVGPDAPKAEVRALGAEGLRLCPTWRATGLPREVLQVTPAIWQDDRLISAPLAGLSAAWQAQAAAHFHLFGLSH